MADFAIGGYVRFQNRAPGIETVFSRVDEVDAEGVLSVDPGANGCRISAGPDVTRLRGTIETDLVTGWTLTLPVMEGACLYVCFPSGYLAADFAFPQVVDAARLDRADFSRCFLPAGEC